LNTTVEMKLKTPEKSKHRFSAHSTSAGGSTGLQVMLTNADDSDGDSDVVFKEYEEPDFNMSFELVPVEDNASYTLDLSDITYSTPRNERVRYHTIRVSNVVDVFGDSVGESNYVPEREYAFAGEPFSPDRNIKIKLSARDEMGGVGFKEFDVILKNCQGQNCCPAGWSYDESYWPYGEPGCAPPCKVPAEYDPTTNNCEIHPSKVNYTYKCENYEETYSGVNPRKCVAHRYTWSCSHRPDGPCNPWGSGDIGYGSIRCGYTNTPSPVSNIVNEGWDWTYSVTHYYRGEPYEIPISISCPKLIWSSGD